MGQYVPMPTVTAATQCDATGSQTRTHTDKEREKEREAHTHREGQIWPFSVRGGGGGRILKVWAATKQGVDGKEYWRSHTGQRRFFLIHLQAARGIKAGLAL